MKTIENAQRICEVCKRKIVTRKGKLCKNCELAKAGQTRRGK